MEVETDNIIALISLLVGSFVFYSSSFTKNLSVTKKNKQKFLEKELIKKKKIKNDKVKKEDKINKFEDLYNSLWSSNSLSLKSNSKKKPLDEPIKDLINITSNIASNITKPIVNTKESPSVKNKEINTEESLISKNEKIIRQDSSFVKNEDEIKTTDSPSVKNEYKINTKESPSVKNKEINTEESLISKNEKIIRQDSSTVKNQKNNTKELLISKNEKIIRQDSSTSNNNLQDPPLDNQVSLSPNEANERTRERESHNSALRRAFENNIKELQQQIQELKKLKESSNIKPPLDNEVPLSPNEANERTRERKSHNSALRQAFENEINNLQNNLKELQEKYNTNLEHLKKSSNDKDYNYELNELNKLKEQLNTLKNDITLLKNSKNIYHPVLTGLVVTAKPVNAKSTSVNATEKLINIQSKNKTPKDDSISNIQSATTEQVDIESINNEIKSVNNHVILSSNNKIAVTKKYIPEYDKDYDTITQASSTSQSKDKKKTNVSSIKPQPQINVSAEAAKDATAADPEQLNSYSVNQTKDFKYKTPKSEGGKKFDSNLKSILIKGGSQLDNNSNTINNFINNIDNNGIIKVSKSIPNLNDLNDLNSLSPLLILKELENNNDYFKNELLEYYIPLFGISDKKLYIPEPNADSGYIQLLYIINLNYIGLDSVNIILNSKKINIPENTSVFESSDIKKLTAPAATPAAATAAPAAIPASTTAVAPAATSASTAAASTPETILQFEENKIYKTNKEYYSNLDSKKIIYYLKTTYSLAGGGYYNYNDKFDDSFKNLEVYERQYYKLHYYPIKETKQPIYNFIIPLIIFKMYRIILYKKLLKNKEKFIFQNIFIDFISSFILIIVLFILGLNNVASILFTDLLSSIVIIYLFLFTYDEYIKNKNKINIEYIINILILIPYFVMYL
jgi:hypothetical protein